MTLDGQAIPIPARKARALLGYLALRAGEAIGRGTLTGLLWGERSEPQARASLRQTLSELRAALAGAAPPPIQATKDAVTWISGAACVDARLFAAAVEGGPEEALRDAAGMLGGELMEGLALAEPAFEQWLRAERERHRVLACTVHERLMQCAERAGRHEEALDSGQALLSLDPLREEIHRALMRLYAGQGRGDAALAQYERCRQELSGHLGVAPEEETEALARSIRAGRRERPRPAAGKAARGERETGTLPNRLPIAVLPFQSLGEDAAQQYLGDGIAEDIITELSRYRSLTVIARNSSFQFRGPAADLATVRQRLGVQYVVQGSIRRMGARLRLSVQLIDAATESHLWAERYDREADEIFAVQDDVTRAIATAVEGRAVASGAEQARRRPTREWVAYDYFLQGREQFNRYDYIAAEPLFARAAELDDGFAQAFALQAKTLVGRYWVEMRRPILDAALATARRALALDETDALCHMAVGFVLTHCGERDSAGPHFDQATTLAPTSVLIAYVRAWWLARMCRAAEALEALDAAMQTDPFPPTWFWEVRAIAQLVARRYDEVIRSVARMGRLHAWDHAYVAACHAYQGRQAEARSSAAAVLAADPRFTISRYARVEAYIEPGELEHLLAGMRKAGLPE